MSGWIESVALSVMTVMMALTFFDVLGRYIFNRPIAGSYELTEYMMAIVVSFSIAYCATHKGHVSIDLVTSRFPQRVQAIIDCITCLLGLSLFSLITWQCALYTKRVFVSTLVSWTLQLPAFPIVGLVTLGSAMFCLVLIAHFFDFLSKAVKK